MLMHSGELQPEFSMAKLTVVSSYVWYCALAFALCAFAASFFTINYEKYLTDNVARKLQYGTPPRVDPEATEK